MVRSSLFSVVLLAASAAAVPYLRVRQETAPPKAVCFPYETQKCDDNACKCEMPSNFNEFGESIAKRKEFLNKYKENGLDWAVGAFSVYFRDIYDEWARVNSSLGGLTVSEYDKKKQEAWDVRGDILDANPELTGEDWSYVYDKLSRNDTSGLVQVPGTKEWVKDSVTPERLQELVDAVHKHDEAEAVAREMTDKLNSILDEFKPWFEEWLKGEEKSLQVAQDDHLKLGVCGSNEHSVSFKTAEAARAHMDHGRYIWEMDDFIARLSRDEMSSGGQRRGALPWPEQYAIEYGLAQTNTVRDYKFDSCRSLTDTCRLFNVESSGQYSCSWFWDHTSTYNGKIGYWAFRTIEGVNHKLKLISDTLTKDTLNTFLKIEKINEDFEKEVKEEDPAWKWFKFAFGMVTNFLPTPPGLDAGAVGNLTEAIEMFQLVIDTFEEISEEVKKAQESNAAKPITSADLGEALSAIFSSMSNGLHRNLEIALGKSERVKEWEKLPSFGNVGNLKTPIGKFLNNPLWLLENDAEVLKSAMAVTAANVQHKIIDMKIRSEGYWLTLDTRTGEKCEGKGARTFNYAGGNKCFQLYKIEDYNNPASGSAERAKDSFYDKLAKYGIEGDNLTKYYENVLDCYQKNGKDGKIDDNVPVVIGGSAPVCYFSMKPVKLEKGKGCDISWAGQVKNCNKFTPVDLER